MIVCNIFPSKRNATFSVSFSMIAMILRSSQNILDYSLRWVHNLCWKLITEKVFFSENKGVFWACEIQKDKVNDHTEKWLFSGAIIWQYGMQIPELVFFCSHHHLVIKIVILPSDINAKFSYPFSCQHYYAYSPYSSLYIL